MKLNDMQRISERYEKIKEAQDDIEDVNKIAEYILDKQINGYISVDVESIEKVKSPITWTTTVNGVTYNQNPNVIGFSVEVPDTILLEAIGIILRNKQQRIKELLNDNNI